MNPRAWEELLQRHLDGEPGALERLMQKCPEADRDGVRRLLAGVSLMKPPAPPDGLTERLAAGVFADLRPRPVVRWRRFFAPGLVAAAAIVVSVWTLWPTPPRAEQPLVVQAEPPAPLRESMAEASSAVVSLSSRAANETVEATTALLPSVTAMMPQGVEHEPAIEPLREATAGVGAAVSPVADSARRAVGLFLRDLPVSRPPAEKKPG